MPTFIYRHVCGFGDGVFVVFCCCRWHSAGTFDVNTKTGGPFRTIKHPDELAHQANNGLDIAVRLLEPIKEQFPILSYADFYQVVINLFSIMYMYVVRFNYLFYYNVLIENIPCFIITVSWSCCCWSYRRAWNSFSSRETCEWYINLIIHRLSFVCFHTDQRVSIWSLKPTFLPGWGSSKWICLSNPFSIIEARIFVEQLTFSFCRMTYFFCFL